MNFSPREQRLYAWTLETGGWVQSTTLCSLEYGELRLWPLNARTIITGAMHNLGQKLDRSAGGARLVQRGGGRAGVEYKLETK